MFVGRNRSRATNRGVPAVARLAVTIVVAAVLATGCAAVEDAIGSDSEETAEETTTTTTAPVFDPDAYCALSHRAEQLNASFSDFADPVALEGFIGEIVGLLNQATPPPEIEAQFITFRRAYVDLEVELAASGFDAAVLNTSPILSDANVNAAIEAVEQHDLALCGPAPGVAAPDTDDTADEAAGDTADDTGDEALDPFAEALATGDFTAMEEVLGTQLGRDAFIEGFTETAPGITQEQAGCFLDNTDIAVLAEMAMDPENLSDESVAGFLETLQICEIPLSAFQTE